MIPLSVYLALCLLAVSSAGAASLLITLFTDSYHPFPTTPLNTYSDDDTEMPDEIPAYPHPPVLVTRWGIHRNHIERGRTIERGCPCCYDLSLHLTPLNPRISRRPE